MRPGTEPKDASSAQVEAAGSLSILRQVLHSTASRDQIAQAVFALLFFSGRDVDRFSGNTYFPARRSPVPASPPDRLPARRHRVQSPPEAAGVLRPPGTLCFRVYFARGRTRPWDSLPGCQSGTTFHVVNQCGALPKPILCESIRFGRVSRSAAPIHATESRATLTGCQRGTTFHVVNSCGAFLDRPLACQLALAASCVSPRRFTRRSRVPL